MRSFSSKFPKSFLILLLPALLMWACTPSAEEVPLDDIDIDFSVHHLEREFLEAAQALKQNPELDSAALYKTYFADDRPFLADWLFYGDMEVASDSLLATIMYEFIADEKTLPLMEDVAAAFPEDGPDPVAPLEDFFKRFSHYFPDKAIPRIVTFADGYPRSIQAGIEQMFIAPKHLGIGLHYLLGPNYTYYPTDMPQYLRRRLQPEFLPVSVAQRYADAMIPEPAFETNPALVDHIVHQGIQMVFVDKLLGPSIADSMKLFYTQQQMEWAQAYEQQVYKEIVPDLYDIDPTLVRRFIDDSPFTSQLNRESAPRMGQFIGWKIVELYLEKNPDTSLAALIEVRDFKSIFKASGYRP